jgi:hypothetical protein
MDPNTGRALDDANPGDDGELPTPVHAYAAAGEKAPRIIRKEDDTCAIQCPRCGGESPVEADNCSHCGTPFTMEGAVAEVTVGGTVWTRLSVAFGTMGLLLSFCGGLGFVPGVIAVGTGLVDLAGGEKKTRSHVGPMLGLLACAISIMVWMAL